VFRPVLRPTHNGYRGFSGCEVAWAWRWPSTHFTAGVKERVELYFYSPSGPSWPCQGWTISLPLCLG
jgi:hypothetical protein